MMRKAGHASLLLIALGGLAGCAGTTEVRMVDPRNGVIATCSAKSASGSAEIPVEQQVNACVQELTFYGFQDEAALLAAAKGE